MTTTDTTEKSENLFYEDKYSDEYTNQVMRTLYALAKTHQNPVLVGDPGTGKTVSVYAMAKMLGYNVVTIIGSQMEPTDISGLPTAQPYDLDENVEIYVTQYASPWWQAKILKEKKIIVFFDEFSNTTPEVQAAMLQFLNERLLPNGHPIPNETLIIGAMNPADSAVDYRGISKPTANRMAWLPWKPSKESWFKGMQDAWGGDISSQERRWRKMIVDFIKEQPEYLHKEPDLYGTVSDSASSVFGVDLKDPSELEVYNNAWPSRRTWDKLAKALPEAHGERIVEDTLMSSLVGIAAASHFRDFVNSNALNDPEEILEDPSVIDWDNIGVDSANMIFRSIVDKLDPKMGFDRFDKVLGVYDYVASIQRADIAAPFLSDILDKGPRMPTDSKERERFHEMIKNGYRDIVRDQKANRRPRQKTQSA